MEGYTESMSRLIDELGKLPGVGKKSAERLAYHLLRASKEEAMALAIAIRDVKRNVSPCSVCFNVADTDPCQICSDARRDQGIICVVEEPKDVIALEKSGAYKGVYHVLMGNISPLEGHDPDALTIEALVDRVKRGGIREVILATNPTHEGEETALYAAQALSSTGATVTRIARGVPSGSYLEYASPAILSDAMAGRQKLSEE